MQKLLTATLLLVSCATHPTSAQKAPAKYLAPHKGQTSKADYSQPSWVPTWSAAEFCAAYSRYFLDLPYLYKYNASQALRGTALADPNSNLTSALAKSVTLREAVYKTLYQHCYNVKYGYGSSRGVDELVYLMLLNDLHLSSSAATHLTLHIVSRYKQAAPPPTQNKEADDSEDNATEESANTPVITQKVYTYVQQMPTLPGGGGMGAIVRAIQATFRYPVAAIRDSVQGKAFASFFVNVDGTTSDVKIVKGLSPAIDAEVIRAIKALPTFIPGKQEGQLVIVSFTVPVTVKLASPGLGKPTP